MQVSCKMGGNANCIDVEGNFEESCSRTSLTLGVDFVHVCVTHHVGMVTTRLCVFVVTMVTTTYNHHIAFV